MRCYYLRVIFVFTLLLFTGCTTATKIVGPDGTENQLISCEQIEDCYQKATEVCGKYKIVNTSSEVSGYNGISGTTVKLLVKCEA